MKKTFLLLAIVGIGFTACKKDEPTPAPKTTKEKIVGKWKGDKVEISITIPPAPTQSLSEDISYVNIEFKNDGTAVADSAGLYPETINWSLIGDTKLIFDSDTFDIQTLSDNAFNFGISETGDIGGGVIGSVEQTIKLKK